MTTGSIVALAVERISRPVEGMHRAIARPWFAATGRPGKVPHLVHDSISRLVYGSIRVGAAVVAAGLDARATVDAPSDDRAGAIANGLWGDALGRRDGHLGIAMSIRDPQGSPITITTETAVPAATAHLVVMVHGLMQTERSWHGTEEAPGLFQAVEAEPDLTSIAVRYNTGLSVATNGEQLAALIEAVHASWPVPVRSIALVGHSMGGLVALSAVATARRAGHAWIEAARDVVTIGTPHKGAPLEKIVHLAARGLAATSQTRPLAEFLEARSQGIKDLRYPSTDVADESTRTADLSTVVHRVVAGVVTSDPAHRMGTVLGDLIVPPSSSTGFPTSDPADVLVVGGANHFDLIHHPVVIERVLVWLRSSDTASSSCPVV
jgi:pimeloyl-ACP methyl ester carboxylesterase